MLEGTIVGAADRGEAEASKELLCEHMHFENEVHVQAAKLAPMHIVNWGEAQEADAALTTCRRWLCTRKDTPFPKWDALLKGLLYVSTTPKREAEGILAFLVPTGQCHTALNGVHWDIGSRAGTILVAHDGRRLPGSATRLPAMRCL